MLWQDYPYYSEKVWYQLVTNWNCQYMFEKYSFHKKYHSILLVCLDIWYGRVNNSIHRKQRVIKGLLGHGRTLIVAASALSQNRRRKRAASLLDHESSPALVFRYVISKKKGVIEIRLGKYLITIRKVFFNKGLRTTQSLVPSIQRQLYIERKSRKTKI